MLFRSGPVLRNDVEVRSACFHLVCSVVRTAHLSRFCRLDRLLLLLDTGSSASVRATAAKQLAQLAAKSVISDVALVEDDVKTTRHHVPIGDPSGWSELMAVLARVSGHITPTAA